jgi:hypothetical protein
MHLIYGVPITLELPKSTINLKYMPRGSLSKWEIIESGGATFISSV